MGAGLTVTLIGYRLVFGRGRPLWAPRFNLPTSTAIDTPLISGAVIFGIGWGVPGIALARPSCHSPADERKLRLGYRDGYGHDRGAMDAGEFMALPKGLGQN